VRTLFLGRRIPISTVACGSIVGGGNRPFLAATRFPMRGGGLAKPIAGEFSDNRSRLEASDP